MNNSGGSVTFRSLTIVIGVAFVLATLFTAWTPGSPTEGQANIPAYLRGNATALPGNWPTPTPRARPLVAIVVGHWGDNNDPGAVCENPPLTELEVNQNIAIRVKNLLETENVDVVLLKEFDPSLQGLVASALVSIHADSCQYINDEATGYKVAASLANPHPERAHRFVACMRDRYTRAVPLNLHSTSITEDMTSYHAFDEIHPDTTAIIIETGFLNRDRYLLEMEPDKPAQGITAGVLCFLNNESIDSEE